MKSLILDTNIVFSAAMNTESRIGQFIMYTDLNEYLFFAPTFLKVEIERHIPKLILLSGLSESVTREIITLLYTRINFIDDAILPIKTYSDAARLVEDVDEYDVHFVALSLYLDEPLWTGDRKLYRHLLSRGFQKVVTFEDILQGLL